MWTAGAARMTPRARAATTMRPPRIMSVPARGGASWRWRRRDPATQAVGTVPAQVFEDEAAMTKSKKKKRSLFSGLLTWGRPDNSRLGTSGEFAYKNNRISRVDRNALQASQTVPLAVSGAGGPSKDSRSPA